MKAKFNVLISQKLDFSEKANFELTKYIFYYK